MLIKFNSADRAEKTAGSTGTIPENLLRQVKEERGQYHSDTLTFTATHTEKHTATYTYTQTPYPGYGYLNILLLNKQRLTELLYTQRSLSSITEGGSDN